MCSNAVLNVEYWRKPVAFFEKVGFPSKIHFVLEKMISSFKKGETLRFADYTLKKVFLKSPTFPTPVGETCNVFKGFRVKDRV